MRRIDEWQEHYLSKSFLQRKNRVVLHVGEEEITAKELAMLLSGRTYTLQAVSRLNSALREFKRLRCADILQLADNITIDDLFDAGCGEASIEVWTLVLNAKGRHPSSWLEGTTKILTRAEKRRRARQ